MKKSGHPQKFHKVSVKAWQDIFRRWDKETKPAWQHLERNCQYLCDTKMEMGELQRVGTIRMETASTWMLKPMRDILVKMKRPWRARHWNS